MRKQFNYKKLFTLILLIRVASILSSIDIGIYYFKKNIDHTNIINNKCLKFLNQYLPKHNNDIQSLNNYFRLFAVNNVILNAKLWK